MKELKKLANQYADSTLFDTADEYREAVKAYEAGFIKAREMSLKIWSPPDPTTQCGHSHTYCDSYHDGLEALNSMGENEVEE